jgi:hypothetical protein
MASSDESAILIAAGTLHLAQIVGIPLRPPPPPSGGMKYMLQTADGSKFLAAGSGGVLTSLGADGPPVVLESAAGPHKDACKWSLAPHPSLHGCWTLQSHSGLYLRCTNYDATPLAPAHRVDLGADSAREWEALTLAPHPSDPSKLLLKSFHGRYVGVSSWGKVVNTETAPSASTAWTVMGTF